MQVQQTNNEDHPCSFQVSGKERTLELQARCDASVPFYSIYFMWQIILSLKRIVQAYKKVLYCLQI